MKRAGAEKLLEVGLALSKEKDPNKLLEIILDAAMEITCCDGGTLYILQENALHFRIMVTKSMDCRKGMDGEVIDMPPVALTRKNASAYCAMEGRLVNIENVYDEADEFDFSGIIKYDAITGYRTTSMLVIPMEDDYGDIIGVLQLINAKNEKNETIAFAEDFEPIIQTLAYQTATCLTNMKYAKEIVKTLDSFVKVMSTAIDARSPYNANHTANMARYGKKFLEWLRTSPHSWEFTKEQEKELIMAIWLHDIGKLVIPLEIMDKQSRLGECLPEIEHRFEIITLITRIDMLTGKISRAGYEEINAEISDAENLIQTVNCAGFVTDELMDRINILAEKTYTDIDNSIKPWITAEEKELLQIRKGTLSFEERKTIENHVVMTEKMLGEMTFSRNYRNVPFFAAAHHEFLNGKGYPHNRADEEIPKEVRLITILDIFDALTAADRPYKKAMTPEQAMGILRLMEKDGQIDGEILNLFEESQAWL